MTVRFIIMNDDVHEDMYCFENGQKCDIHDLLEILTPASRINYEYTTAYYPDIEEAFAQAHEDFDADDVEGVVTNLFDHVMHEYDVDYEKVYLPAFNEIWELASNL